MAIKKENMFLFEDECNILADQVRKIGALSGQGKRSIDKHSDLTVSAQAEVEALHIGNVDKFDDGSTGRVSQVNTQRKIVAEIFKNATPPLYKVVDPTDADFGKFKKVSDDTVYIDPATI